MLGQRKLLQRLVPGLMHAFIFWGFIVLFPTIAMAMIAVVDARRPVARRAWFELLANLFGCSCWSAWRRRCRSAR